MTASDLTTSENHAWTAALQALDEGNRVLEQAYRELWEAREAERGRSGLQSAEVIRDFCHEIKNPLGGVRGLAGLLDRELAGAPDPERARRLLRKMISGLEAAWDVLDRHAIPDTERVDAGRVAEEVCALAKAERHAAGATIRFRVEAAAGIELPLSTLQFREVLANLVANAAEACGDAGTVAVTVASNVDAVWIQVEDDGCGLPNVADERLFLRGFSTKGTARGRGLALTSAIVEQVGASMTLGRLQQGTLVRVRFPRVTR